MPEPLSALSLYLRDIRGLALLDDAAELELARRVRAGDAAARTRMIHGNLRLVVNIARRYQHRGLTLAELIGEGNVGLIRAVEKFDPSRGARFATYAAWWIKQRIRLALINAVQPVPIPAYMARHVAHWKQIAGDTERRLGRPAGLDEIIDQLNLPPGRLKSLYRAVLACRHAAQDATGREDAGTSEADGFSLSQEPAEDDRPDQQAEHEEQLTTLGLAMQALDDRERTILQLRFGLDDQSAMTFERIGRTVGLTRERVRQIEMQARAKLRQSLAA